MTMQASFHVTGHRAFTVLFEAESAAQLMDSWGELIALFKEIDPTVASICLPIQERAEGSTT